MRPQRNGGIDLAGRIRRAGRALGVGLTHLPSWIVGLGPYSISLLRSIWAVFLFEIRRTLTLPRAALWVGLICFPGLIVGLMRYSLSGERILPEVEKHMWTIALHGLIPEVVCVVGLLLWMTPAIQFELEGKTWVYLSVRPNGRRAVLLGKYAAALVWTVVAGWLAVLIAVPIAMPPDAHLARNALLGLVLLSCMGRGAIFALFAVAIPQRAMVFSFAYYLLFEVVVGLIPALVNQLTVQLRLRSLLVEWMDWTNIDPALSLLIDTASPTRHLSLLLLYTVVVLTAAIVVLEQRQFPTSDEG